jgi:hypothetical protein
VPLVVPESAAIDRAGFDRPMRRALRVSEAGGIGGSLRQQGQRGNGPSVFARVDVPIHARHTQTPPRRVVQFETRRAMGSGPDATSQQKQAAMQQYSQKLAANPSGILMCNPPGMQAPRQFIAEFVTELIESLLAVWLLAQRLASFASCLGFVCVGRVGAAMVKPARKE